MFAYVTTDKRGLIGSDSTVTIGTRTVRVPDKVDISNDGAASRLAPHRLAVAVGTLDHELADGEPEGGEGHVWLPIRPRVPRH